MLGLRRPASALVATAILALGGAGCRQDFMSDVRLHADGSLDRSIYQPVDKEQLNLQALGWKEVVPAPAPSTLEKRGWSGELAELFKSPGKADSPYVATRGRFPSVKDLPGHFRAKAPPDSGLSDGTFRAAHRRTDLVVAVHTQA
jgi:hypothetical protein